MKKKKAIPKIKIHTSAELVPISSVHLWKDNPRKNDRKVSKLADLILKNGLRSPVVCWTKNRVIYKGNTTYKALKLLGVKNIPVSWQDFTSEEAAIAYGISDNRSNEFSQWDDDVLINIMSSEGMKEHKQQTGFKESEFSKLLLKQSKSDGNYEKRLPKVIILHHPEVSKQLHALLSRVLKRFGDKVVIQER